jgi:hypothetical protein
MRPTNSGVITSLPSPAFAQAFQFCGFEFVVFENIQHKGFVRVAEEASYQVTISERVASWRPIRGS